MIYHYGILVFIVGYLSTTSALAPCVCTRHLKPVSGSDGITYNNECLLNCAQTRNEELVVASRGTCENPGQCICTLEYKPVCGSDGRTYANKCSFECHSRSSNVEIVHNGECRTKRDAVKIADIKPCICTKEKKPVCGTDGRTYTNPCLLNCAKDFVEDLHVEHVGPCPKTSGPVIPHQNTPPCTCSRFLQPVCASNGQTYPNECMMQCAGAELTVERYEPCEYK